MQLYITAKLQYLLRQAGDLLYINFDDIGAGMAEHNKKDAETLIRDIVEGYALPEGWRWNGTTLYLVPVAGQEQCYRMTHFL